METTYYLYDGQEDKGSFTSLELAQIEYNKLPKGKRSIVKEELILSD